MQQYVPFTRIRQIIFQAPEDGSCPKTVKLFVNKEGMDFDDAADTVPTETLELSQQDASIKNPKLFNVKITKFRNVSSLTV
jgi:hypothetical protein